MFDVDPSQRLKTSWDADLPIEDHPWNVGLIIGPSGAGKTTLARHFWPQVSAGFEWSGKALIDDFPASMGIKEVTGVLNSVGLSSPPSWLRPYATLSNGEAFRATIARALAETAPGAVTVIDEFTSVVDRQVAKVASHTVQKTVRRNKGQFVAVTCHYDVTEWLQPDWVFDVSTGSFAWRSVQRHPQLELGIAPVGRSAWQLFRRHHYLSGDLLSSSQCWGGWIDGVLVAFVAVRHFPHAHVKNMKMSHRVVVLPDYQGLGISGRMIDWIGQDFSEKGFRLRATTAHPARQAFFSRSPRWKNVTVKKQFRNGPASSGGLGAMQMQTRRLTTRSFEYLPTKRA